jgi:hypothetical protein
MEGGYVLLSDGPAERKGSNIQNGSSVMNALNLSVGNVDLQDGKN